MSAIQLPTGCRARPPVLADAQAVADLLNEAVASLVEGRLTTGADIRRDWTAPDFNLAADAVVVEDADGRIVGSEEFWSSAPHVRMRGWGAVHPEHRDRGIGSALFEWLLTRAQADVAKAPPDARVVIHVPIVAGDAGGATLLTSRDFRAVRTFYRQSIELGAPPPPAVWPDGIEVRTFLPGVDDRPAFDCACEAFADHWGHADGDIEAEFREFQHWNASNPDFDPTLYWLALDDERIVGVCFALPSHEGDEDLAYVSTLAVPREYRRRGIARALLLHAFGEFHRRGKPRLCLGVDADSLTGATGLYEQVGMHVSREYRAYELELRPGQAAYKESL